jgi:hypothetical protein
MQGFANLCYPSDVYPFEVLGVSPSGSQIKVRAMSYKIAADSPKLDFTPGGFVGHFSNLRDQKFDYAPDHTAPISVAYLRKNGRYYLGGTPMSLSDKPHYYRNLND